MLFLALCLNFIAQAQYISEVLEYVPAPGQFVNTDPWGIPGSAESLVGGIGGSMTLGVFGGYVIFKFENSVENDPDNPYGVDFTVFGNPLTDWSEPGIVSVMKDENENGEPDDTWYVLAGSDYFFSTSIKNYEVTYINPDEDIAADVLWKDNTGDSGYVYANSYHTQQYYPLHDSFPAVGTDSYTLSGAYVEDNVDRSVSSYILSYKKAFGYVDNQLKGSAPYTVPDNPYTDDKENSGGDAFDISWAVDEDGNYVDLDEIDFVKVHNGVLADAGWLGEVSTEITGAVDVPSDASVTDYDSVVLVVKELVAEMDLEETFDLEALLFVMGRKTDTEISWSAEPASKVSIDDNNVLTAIDTGTVTVSASCTYNGLNYSESSEILIIAPATVEIIADYSEIRVNEKYQIDAAVLDQSGDEIEGLELVWESSNENITVKEYDDTMYVAGVDTGTASVYVYPNGYPDLRDTLDLTILEAADSLNIYLTVKTDETTTFLRTKIAVSNFELTDYITNPVHSYGLSDITNVTAVHAVASVFENEAFESDLRFKDSDNDGLYIYKLPVTSGYSTSYYYGYGNIGDDGNTGCWIVKVDDDMYFNNLEDVVLFEGDEVIAYYVEDATSEWDVYYLLNYTITQVDVNETITLMLEKETFYFYNDITIMSTGSASPVAGESVYVDGELYSQNGSSAETGSDGTVELSFSSSGVYEVQLANEVVEITVGDGTGINEITASVSLSPNPADDVLAVQIAGMNGIVFVKITNITGNELIVHSFENTGEAVNFDVSGFEKGMYILQLSDANKSVTEKFLVK